MIERYLSEPNQPGLVVITGASAGIGRACVRMFAKNGYDVAMIARGKEALEAAKKEVEALGRHAVFHIVDIADAGAVDKAAAEIEQELGPIDVWVNNAMNSVFSPVKEMLPEEYKRVTEVTYLGQVYGALAALKRMLPRNRGKIVFVGSALAFRGIPLQSAYCASKHAIEGFYDSLRTELIHDKSKVQILTVHLPALNTTQFGFVKSRLSRKARPMGTIFQPEVAAEAILYGAQSNRRSIYVTWSTIQVIIASRLFPNLVDYVLARTGYEGQQTNDPENPNRKHNLWDPVPGAHGAHGEFDEQASGTSPQLWLTKNRGYVASGVALALVGFLFGKNGA
ncbi:MAG: SDR family oxidoreductase [Balneolales bacterium]